MPRKNIEFNLDFMKRDILSKFAVKQFDDVTFTIKTLINNEAYDVSNMTAKIYVGVNNEMYMQDTNITVSNNSIVVKLDKNMLANYGRTYAEIELTDSQGTVTSSSFRFDIDKKIGEGSNIPGAIEGFVEKYKKLTEEFKKKFLDCLNNVDDRFNILTSQQQQDSEVILARKGEISLKSKIDKIDEQFISKASKQEVDLERKRINLLTKIESGQTQGNTELLDIRIGTDGKEYETAGNSIRTQFMNISKTLQESSVIKTGDYTQAVLESLENNSNFQFLLKTSDFTKLIWHIGNSVFIDAVGAIIEDEINEKLVYNFTYKVKLTADNETVYVPVDSSAIYDMYVDWGDGSQETHFTGTGFLQTCSHQYTGNIGDIFTITLYGNIPFLNFASLSRGGTKTLYSVENNTLKNSINLTFATCTNLVKIAKNTFNNYNGTSINFSGCTSLSLIEEGFSKYIDKSKITSISFSGTSISSIDDDLFDGITLTTADGLFNKTKLTRVPSSLPKALSNCSNFSYTFYGIKEPLTIPNNLFDYVTASVTDVRNCFNGGSAADISPLSGDAKVLYDTLLSKISGTYYAGCFSNNTLSNRNQVPTAWGGTM